VTRAADERVPLLVWVVLGGVLVVVFEALLYLTAVMLFPHIDTPDCASTDTFCFPDGRPGVTGGAIVVAVGHLGAVAILVAALVLLVIRRLMIRRRAARTPA
jgi:hypothetical protein